MGSVEYASQFAELKISNVIKADLNIAIWSIECSLCVPLFHATNEYCVKSKMFHGNGREIINFEVSTATICAIATQKKLWNRRSGRYQVENHQISVLLMHAVILQFKKHFPIKSNHVWDRLTLVFFFPLLSHIQWNKNKPKGASLNM